ncbi:MAG: translational GTPase TypA [Phycisphaerae bacterium]|nr:MAG: translational GTPase TypA [Planctomycetota bacterium]KAB2943347.1 MAG: translational GTPase TypA [Phycisphaerae bacterium]MBE7458661.1 translational GTPase TypA [Planctomycetia bacterium]MCK6466377.1 translational GTPase TypA [Phycisphaerae bacterium]MCL4720138.1 translational GTPase TypA [Phycisphaerae bacterium]
MLNLRNVAIIAHVDHGKTTLVDQMLRQCGQFRQAQLKGERILDSNDLERERGITILAKNIAIRWRRETDNAEYKINLIDTPGHADFGGEVERVLKMADGCLLLVDAFEGPMPQTRFVLRKAFEYHLRPIVVINKMDRPDARPKEVVNEVFDLFIELNADDAQLDFPIVYASATKGWATLDPGSVPSDVFALFETIVKHVPAPKDDPAAPLQMLVTTLDYNDYVGRIGIGRVFAGTIRGAQKVCVIHRDGTQAVEQVGEVFAFDGLGRTKAESVSAGDICAVVGIESVDIGNTLADPDHPVPLPIIAVDEPTLHMLFRVNDSPFCGRSGKFVTSRHLRDRLEKELEKNVALRVEPGHTPEEFHVSGRGILHLSVLIENMRREGFELAVGKPKVIYRELKGHKTEPIELCVIDVPTAHVGAVMELMGGRRGICLKMESRGDSSHMEFTIPSRGLIGLRNRIMTATQGTIIMHHSFYEYEYLRGAIPGRTNGVLIASEPGQVTAYALEGLADRGVMFVTPGDQVYEGMIVGEHNRENDIEVNVARTKKLTNMRAAGADKTVVLKTPRQLTLELALEFIADDELVEVTPDAVRLRKRLLSENDRKRAGRAEKGGG